MEIREGQVIDGLFRVTKSRFKKGGEGEIHLACDRQGRTVVLKFLQHHKIEQNKGQLKREYQTLLKFSHPSVARVYHFGEHDGQFFIVYEFVEGEEFRVALLGKKPEEKIPQYIQLLEALEAIHIEGMLHLDIKSANVLITKDGKVKLVDFGLAIAREDYD